MIFLRRQLLLWITQVTGLLFAGLYYSASGFGTGARPEVAPDWPKELR